jgi:hypothetical protein
VRYPERERMAQMQQHRRHRRYGRRPPPGSGGRGRDAD